MLADTLEWPMLGDGGGAKPCDISSELLRLAGVDYIDRELLGISRDSGYKLNRRLGIAGWPCSRGRLERLRFPAMLSLKASFVGFVDASSRLSRHRVNSRYLNVGLTA